MPITEAARSKAWVCSHLLAGIAGSNPFRNMDVCVLWVLCVVSGFCVGLITRPEESYRLWCVVVWSWSHVREGHDTELGRSATGKCTGLEQCSKLFGNCTFRILTGTSAILTTILVLYISHSTQCPNSASNRPRLLIPNHLHFLSHPNIDAVVSDMQSIVKNFKPNGYCMYHQAYN